MKQRLAILAVVVAVAALGCGKAMAFYNPHIISVDVQIDGVSPGNKVNPGGYLAVGGARKKVTFSGSLDPANLPAAVRVSWVAGKIQLQDASGAAVVPSGSYSATVPYKDFPQAAASFSFDLYVTGLVASANCMDEAVTIEALNNSPSMSDTVKFTVLKARITSLAPVTNLELGDDLAVNYELLGPSGFSFDAVELHVYNASDVLIYKRTGLDATVGTHVTTWEKAKWNQSPHSGAYANPDNGMYKVKIMALKGSCVAQDMTSINTRWVLRATLEDNPLEVQGVQMATGLDSPANNVKITITGPDPFFTGQEFAPTFGSPVMEDLLGDGDPLEIRRIDLSFTCPQMNVADNGVYTVRVVHGHDVAGNVAGDDRDPNNPQWTVEIW